MIDILIEGNNAQHAAAEMRSALLEIFATDPLPSSRTTSNAPGTRGPIEFATLVLTLPITAIAAADLTDRLRRLIAKATATRRATGARLLIDPGNGKPIPLEQANHETIRAALATLEANRKP